MININKKLSLVIPTKNRTNDLMTLVESIINQSLMPDELIIIDQSDTPKSKELVQNKWRDVRNSKLIYVLDANIKGLVDAKRHGASISSYELVCFLDDDLILDNHFLKQIVEPFRFDSKIMGSSGVFINFPVRSKLYLLMYSLFHKGIFSDPRPQVFRKYEGYTNPLLSSNVLWGGITIWNADVLKKVPFDNKNFLFMMEDFDYSAKVRNSLGNNFFINPNARAIHNHSDINRASETEQEARKISEYIAYYNKRKTSLIDLINLLWLMIGLFLHVLYQSLKVRNIRLIKAFFKGINNSKDLIKN